MELKTAIEILEYHQEWRLGKRDDMIHEPKTITEALDRVLDEVKRKMPITSGSSACPVCRSKKTYLISSGTRYGCDLCLSEFEV